MSNQKPKNWGKDKLSDFLDTADNNLLATFDRKREAYSKLQEVDDCFHATIDHLINCKPIVSVFLFLRAHSAFRAACRIAMSGQLVETFPLCRVTIENGLYAFHIYDTEGAEEIWINREKNDDALRQSKREFSYSNVLSTLQRADERLSNIADTLYKRAINYGGHPNEPGVTDSLQIFKNDRTVELNQLYLHGDSGMYDVMLKNVTQFGLFPLKIAQKLWDFRVKFSGVYERISSLEMGDL